MTAKLELTLSCDGTAKGCLGEVSTSERMSVARFRDVARYGYLWAYRSGRDLCPVCAATE